MAWKAVQAGRVMHYFPGTRHGGTDATPAFCGAPALGWPWHEGARCIVCIEKVRTLYKFRGRPDLWMSAS